MQCRRHGFNLWVRKIPWRRVWQPIPVFLPRKFYGQRTLVGPWGHKESQTWLSAWTHTQSKQRPSCPAVETKQFEEKWCGGLLLWVLSKEKGAWSSHTMSFPYLKTLIQIKLNEGEQGRKQKWFDNSGIMLYLDFQNNV